MYFILFFFQQQQGNKTFSQCSNTETKRRKCLMLICGAIHQILQEGRCLCLYMFILEQKFKSEKPQHFDEPLAKVSLRSSERKDSLGSA